MVGEFFFKEEKIICPELKVSGNGDVLFKFQGRLFYDNDEIVLERILNNIDDVASFESIRGQFVFVMFDKKANRLLLVRDHFGVIPLYYYVDNKKIIFGTDINSLLEKTSQNVQVNRNVIQEYFLCRFIAGRSTIFRNVFEVQPGTMVTIDKSAQVTEKQFYKPRYSQKKAYNKGKTTETVFQEKFLQSLSSQTQDKERKKIGILSSGGIDSSILVSCGEKILNPAFNTYYVANEGYEYNKTGEVDYLSKIFNTNHQNILVSGSIFADNLIETIRINEEPLDHPSSVLRYYLNNQIKNEVDVLLSGEGADCLYCGYYIFDLIKYFYIKNPIRPLTRFGASLLPTSLFPSNYRNRIEKVINIFLHQPEKYTIFFSDLSSMTPEDSESLLNFTSTDEFFEKYNLILTGYSKKSILDLVLSIYQGYFLVESLNTITKIGSVTGIEFRHPFIDYDLVNNFNQFSWDDKIKFFKRKHQIVELGKKYLPKEFFNKRKEGFGVPLKRWFYDESGTGRFIQLLDDKKTRERGIFKTKSLDKLKLLYKSKEIPDEQFETVLWPIINLELWFRIFIDRDIKGY